MKKILPLVLAAVLALGVAGCGAQKETTETSTETGTAGLANPMTAVGSLEELNTLVQGNIPHPPVMGVTDESFYTINHGDTLIGEYNYAINGISCTVRFICNTTDDISGIYADGKPLFATSDDVHAETEDYLVERWFTIDGQYVLMVKNENVPEGWFANAVEELQSLTFTGDGDVGGEVEEPNADASLYKDMEGAWSDPVSQRASATVKAEEDGIVVTVSWAESAFTNNLWTMKAAYSADNGKLTYTDCKHIQVDYLDDENGKEAVISENGSGFFTYKDGKLLWDGAADESCRTCAFEKD